jgi:sugar lactone lactonase YvrE
MKFNLKLIVILISFGVQFTSCKKTSNNKSEEKVSIVSDSISQQIIQVAAFKGQQVTGVSVSQEGRVFVNFPRWRKGVENSVVELSLDNKKEAYPNAEWNSWEIGQPVTDNKFVGVQSVVSFDNKLYVLDTRSALFQNVLDAPRIFVFDLSTNYLIRTYILGKNSFHPNSYINDLRVDKKKNKIYFTDSGHGGLIALDIDSGKSKRILNNHVSTTAEMASLHFGEKEWKRAINSDGIALDTGNDKLYYHALTGYSLFSINTNVFEIENEKQIEESVKFEGKTAAPDGMIFDKEGNLFFADLENNKIQYRKPDGSIHTLIEGNAIKWADSFSIYSNYLYFTNSRINEVTEDISDLIFTLNKIKLPAKNI